MSINYVLGFVCGLIIGLVLVAVFLKVTKTDGASKCKFDERQQLVRGKGFKYGFFTMLICNALLMMKEKFVETAHFPIENAALLFIGICIGVLVYVSYCIWNEGYFALNENPKKVLIGFGVITIANILIGLVRMENIGLQERAEITFGSYANLICGFFMTIILVEVIAKWICNKKGEE